MDDITEAYNATHDLTKHEQSTQNVDELFVLYGRLVGGLDEPQTNLTDLLADLMHWAEAHEDDEVNFDAALSSAEFHFGFETDDPDPPHGEPDHVHS